MSAGPDAGLWLAVVGFGLFHGLNPAMGWPLAVANGLAEKRDGAVFATGWSLAVGHFVAMAVVLLPFAALAAYVQWTREIRLAAGALVLGFGVYRLAVRRHPRFLARVRPTELAWWSFLMATAHGAGLMLLPVALSLCARANPSSAAGAHEVLTSVLGSGLAVALAVAAVHTVAMIGAGLAAAWTVYRYLGLRYLRRTFVDVDVLWGATLVLTGLVSGAFALLTPP